MTSYQGRLSDRAPVDGRQSYIVSNNLRGSSSGGSENGIQRGGVGLVFRKDEGPTPSSFLLVSEVLPGGPAFKSGMIKPGDRLRKIDGVELGSAPEQESPQLPGQHGSTVTLTLERPSRGSRFDPTVGILSYNIKVTRSSNFFPDKLQSTADARDADLARKERESRYEARYGGGGAGWYSSGYEKLAVMAASMSEEKGEVNGDAPKWTPSTRSKTFETPFEKTIPSFPPMVDSTAFGREPDISDFDGDGLIGQAEEKLAKDEVDSLKKYVVTLQQELGEKRLLETRTKALEQDLKLEQARREQLEIAAAKENLREKLLEEEITALRNEDREVDLKVLVRGKMDQLMREREILLTDLRNKQVQHRNETQELQDKIAQMQREKDELRIDMRIEADNERARQQERYQEYHAKTTAAMRAMAQDLADAVREKEEAKAALTKFRVGDGALWEEENHGLKDKNMDLKSRLSEDKMAREEAQKKAMKAEKLAVEVVRLRAELKRNGIPIPSTLGRSGAETPTRVRPSGSPPRERVSMSPPRARASPAVEQVSSPESASADRSLPQVMQTTPTRAIPMRTIDSVVLGTGAADRTDEIMSLYLSGQDKTVIRDVPLPRSPERQDRFPENLVEEEGVEGPFPLGTRGHLMEVVVSKARQLPGEESVGEKESYVVVSFRGNPIGTTQRKKGSLPVWNESFKESAANGTTGLISIVLYQNKAGSGQGVKSDCVGYVAVPLERVMQTGLEEGWYDLLDQDNQPVSGTGGAAEVLVRVSSTKVEQPLKSMSGWVRSQVPGSAKDAPVQGFVWQLDPYAGVIRSSKGMASATEIGEDEWRLALKDWEVVEDQAAVRSIAGKVVNGVDGFCFLLSKKEERETMLVEVNSEGKRTNWVAALTTNTVRSEGGGTQRVMERAQVRSEESVIVEQPNAVVDIWVLGSRNLPVGTAREVVCEVGKQKRAVSATESAAAVTWNESVQLGVKESSEQIKVTIREVGMLGTTLAEVNLGPANQAAKGDGWVGEDGWVKLEEKVARMQDQANMGSAELRLHVAMRGVVEEMLVEAGAVGWMDKANASEPRKAFAVLDPYIQDLRLYEDREAAVLGERGRLAGTAKEPIVRHGIRSCDVARLDMMPSHDGTVMMSVQPAEGEPGPVARLVVPSDDAYVRWKSALSRVAHNPSKAQRKIPMIIPKAAASPANEPAPQPPSPPAPQPPSPPEVEKTRAAPQPPPQPEIEDKPPQRPPPPPEIEEVQEIEEERSPEPSYPPPQGLIDVETKVPKGLLEVFIFRAQDLPALDELGPGPKKVWGVVRAGDETCTTRKLDLSSETVPWDETFQLGARGEASDLVTVILWAAAPPNEPVSVGHIAVPISRVQASGQEEGWYEVRDRTGQVVKGAKGASMIRVGIVYSNVSQDLADGRARIAGWLVTEAGRGRKVVGVVNPFCEQLQVFASEQDAREGKNVLEVQNLPGAQTKGISTFKSELQAVVASERRKGVWEQGFVLARKDVEVQYIVEESRHVQAWLDAVNAGCTGATQRREARKLKKAAEKKKKEAEAEAGAAVPSTQSPTKRSVQESEISDRRSTTASHLSGQSGQSAEGASEAVEVVVERARNLEGTYTKGPVKGFLCSVQMREQKHATSLARNNTDTPIWKERFTVQVVDAAMDLATVMLHVQTEDDSKAPECIGHIAVPASRIVKKGREEGWYDITNSASTTGELLASDAGKSGLLVSFRYKGAKVN